MCNYFQKLAVILCLSTLCISSITAQSNSLRVQDPQQTWRAGTARIETASFDVRPRGLYAEVSLNMTYSAQGTSYSASTDTLEIQHYFTLPANALVTDSWLWVENQIVYAKLIDRWTASAIYEGIVKRRQDPSILFKNQATGYEYRIFPMAGNKTRRVQLHFMMPIEWQSGSATFELPTNLLRFGNRTPNTTVRIFNNAQWKNPRLTDFPTQTLTAASDSTTNQPILTTTLTATQVNSSSNPRISYNSPMKNGVFVSTFKQGGENFYQMAIQPDQFLNVNTAPRKLLYLVDYNTNQAALTAADLVATIKQNIRSTLTARDSFNFIFSRLLPTPLSNKWISAANLETTLAQITEANVSAFSNLPNVLAKGIEFTKNNTGGEIALISNDASISSLNAANALLADLKSTFPVLPVIHVLDYSTTSIYFWLNNTYYYGNDYFYNIITSQTGGNFTNAPLYNYSDIKVFFTQFFRNSTAYFENFQTYTTLTTGYCHSRFDIGSTGVAYINKPILQVGKFAGQTPFQVEVTGSYQGTPFGKRVSIPDSLVTNGDSTMRQIWAGAQILTWEAQTPRDNATTKRVIEMSQNNLVLSLFTAFLALEPNMGGDTCRSCRNPTVTVTATKDIANDSFRMAASPNPFNKTTTLKVTFPAFKVGQKADLTIYTLMGKAVKRFDLDIKTGDTSAEVNWEASDVPAGMYIVRFTSGTVVKTLKIVKTE